MLQTLRDAFKIKDLRRRIGFTFLMLIVVRLGSLLPVPGINGSAFSSLFADSDSALNFFDSITGGSFSAMSVFALNITPYITSSIIMQLLTIAFPKLEEMQRDGEAGRKKMTQITRYLTIGLALGESIAMAIGFGRSGYLVAYNPLYVILVVASLTAGSAVLMWIGERITERGIGNGISIVLTINIISRIPSDLTKLYEQFMKGKTVPKATLAGIIIAAIIVALVVFVVILQSAERRIPVQYSNKIQGRRQVGGNSSVIPMKVNTAGVIPVIFAQSLLQTPIMLVQLFDKNGVQGFWGKVLNAMNQSNWFNPGNWVNTIGAVVYVLLIIGFAYFYTEITFNPLEIAENLKRSGGFIPGIRPGKPTSDYLTSILKHIIFIGAIGLSIVAILPLIFNGLLGASVSFGGTSIIIIVGVIVETLKQVESQMMVRNYKGFLND
ncbi:protein translocase subunit secY/sec61 alpha [Pseudobutyrivibrio sp. 49]|uniref:preprotein translocase subunit SecY n=1 Tax=unclassified Pseudobutyrivibrio TaxID=2638619 RepID=UPI00089075E2|nr:MULTISPECIES: preprotein translocase subunit SecY [unclassified Pseudobutyrivibrio]SDI24561.1 protein translocase subunit secY/sec61 alpha [Pseudobutyrivibrio sp. 49]SFO13640.1 protein translocase subunit secY/sec61 alpha [Pseudobutyrivibrio sp. UC1225]